MKGLNMRNCRKTLSVTTSLFCMVLFVLIVLSGCKKQAQPVTDANGAVSAVLEQTMCPVLTGNKIDKNIYVVYKGKKVYFCCTDCKAAFEKEPEKYISKLPQFK